MLSVTATGVNSANSIVSFLWCPLGTGILNCRSPSRHEASDAGWRLRMTAGCTFTLTGAVLDGASGHGGPGLGRGACGRAGCACGIPAPAGPTGLHGTRPASVLLLGCDRVVRHMADVWCPSRHHSRASTIFRPCSGSALLGRCRRAARNWQDEPRGHLAQLRQQARYGHAGRNHTRATPAPPGVL